MAGVQSMVRNWLIDLEPAEAQIRCSYLRAGKRIERFTVQLEIRHLDTWHPVVRYDNAHGFCHRDTLHPNDTQDKTALFIGDTNETFTFAIADCRTNWEAYRDRYLRELEA